MKFTSSRLAVAATLALTASSSFAALSDYTPGPGVTDIYLAGSSAVDLALTKFIAQACTPGTLNVYRSDAGVKTYYLWTCQSGSFGTANSKLAIHKNTNSSGDGVALLQPATGATVAFLGVSDLSNLAGCTTTAVPAALGIPAYNVNTCGASVGTAGTGTTLAKPQLGFTDSEPAQFGTAAAPASNVVGAVPFGLIFGIPVSKTLRNALQDVQFPGNTFTVADRELEVNMPNVASAQINAIFTGRYSNWTAAMGVTLPDNNIYKVRRSNTSGTTRIFNATFVGEFCVPGVAPASTGTAITNPAAECLNAAPRTKQAATSDDMAACISKYDTQGLGAIGHLSTDYQPTAGDGYRFVKVDGYVPKLLNVIDNKYKMWSELSMNYPVGLAPTGDLLAFYTRFQAASNDAAYLSAVDTGLTQPLGGWVGGVVGVVPNNKNVTLGLNWGLQITPGLNVLRTDASVLAYPSSAVTRATSSGYNLCAPLYNAVPFPVANPAVGYQAQ